MESCPRSFAVHGGDYKSTTAGSSGSALSSFPVKLFTLLFFFSFKFMSDAYSGCYGAPIRGDPSQEFYALESMSWKCGDSFCEQVLNYPSAMSFYSCSKNRYGNILPNECSRVKLRPLESIEGSDYINANHILDGRYISTQAPMPNTINDFWRMIWEQHCAIIVMITRIFEGGRQKANIYWPTEEGGSQKYGIVEVTTARHFCTEHFDTRIFLLRCGNETRKVVHYQYSTWPDFGVPHSTEGIRELVRKVRRQQARVTPSGPIVVHCSAGVGRSGAFISILHTIERAHAGLSTNLMELVMEMRKDRSGMIQTKDQYAFVVKCLEDYFAEEAANSRVHPIARNRHRLAKRSQSLQHLHHHNPNPGSCDPISGGSPAPALYNATKSAPDITITATPGGHGTSGSTTSKRLDKSYSSPVTDFPAPSSPVVQVSQA